MEVIKKSLATAAFAVPCAAGLGFAIGRTPDALGAAATTLFLVLVAGAVVLARGRAGAASQGAGVKGRKRRTRKRMLLAGALGLVPTSTGIAWIATSHSPGGSVLIAAGILLPPLLLLVDFEGKRRSG